MNRPLDRKMEGADAFAATKPPSLAGVLARCEAELVGTALRDTRSAFRFLERKAGIDLATVPATPDRVREVLEGLNAAVLGVSDLRLANLKSLVRKAVQRFGPRRVWITREVAVAPEWQGLLESISVRQHRWGLNRLACYCTIQAIAPSDVCSEHLAGFQAALEAECLVKDPANIRKQTIAIWNMCVKRVPGWPQTRLASPFKGEAYMLPLEAFPQGLRDDVAAWERRMSNPDPLDPDAPVRAMRPDTLLGYQFAFRRLASALVREHGMDAGVITGLDVLCEVENLKHALRRFLPERGYSAGFAYKMAAQMRNVARHLLRLPQKQLEDIDRLVGRIKPPASGGIGSRNRERLKQFDNDEAVRRLLAFPDEELGRALAKPNPFRRAKGVERALAISLLIHTGLRIKNLRRLRLDDNLRRAGSRVFVMFFTDETKNHTDLELELPAETIALLDRFVSEHRPLLPGSEGPYLFPSPDGGARSYSGMREAVGKPLKRHAGIVISPHLYRHAIAKIVAERRPELMLDVSRRLGHKRIQTTYESYLGTEGPAASRRISALLQATRDGASVSRKASRKAPNKSLPNRQEPANWPGRRKTEI